MKHGKAFTDLVDTVRARVRETDIESLKKRLSEPEPFILLDVREESEYKAGHIPDALWMGKGIIERDIESNFPEKDTELWLYCGGGYRSVLAADNIQKMGYTNVVSVDGGFRGWLQSNLPIETPESEQ